MSPSIQIEYEKIELLQRVLGRTGKKVNGDVYQVIPPGKPGSGEPELLAIDTNKYEVIGSPAMIAAVQGWLDEVDRLFAGNGLFEP